MKRLTREEVTAKWLFPRNSMTPFIITQSRKMLHELDACGHPQPKQDKQGRILCVCGLPAESSKHVKYGPDEDNPVKHIFDPAVVDAAEPKKGGKR